MLVEGVRYCAWLVACTVAAYLLEEVVAFVVNQDECREVFNCDFPNGFHSEFGVLDALDALDAGLREHRGSTADCAEIETTVFLAGIGDFLSAVALGNHNKRCAVLLEFIHIGVHAIGRCGAHRSAWIAIGSLGRSGIKNGMVLEILRHILSGVEASFEASVSYVASHDDGAAQVDACANRVF